MLDGFIKRVFVKESSSTRNPPSCYQTSLLLDKMSETDPTTMTTEEEHPQERTEDEIQEEDDSSANKKSHDEESDDEAAKALTEAEQEALALEKALFEARHREEALLEKQLPSNAMVYNGTITPSASFYKVNPTIRLAPRILPYTEKNKGLGINLFADFREPVEVMANSRRDCIRFNEPTNQYGLYLVALIIDKVRNFVINEKSGTPSTPASATRSAKKRKIEDQDGSPQKRGGGDLPEGRYCIEVIVEEHERLTKLAEFPTEKINPSRHAPTYKAVMNAFNTDGRCNKALDDILIFFIKIRLGMIPDEGSEFKAAVTACQQYYLTRTSDVKSAGSGPWTLPLVHLLNGHLYHVKLPTITFLPTRDDDVKFAEPERVKNSKTIWVMHPTKNKKVECSVETRYDVIKAYKDYVAKFHPTVVVELNEEVQAPEEEDDVPEQGELQENLSRPPRKIT